MIYDSKNNNQQNFESHGNKLTTENNQLTKTKIKHEKKLLLSLALDYNNSNICTRYTIRNFRFC
jgi:hypothetical protein